MTACGVKVRRREKLRRLHGQWLSSGGFFPTCELATFSMRAAVHRLGRCHKVFGARGRKYEYLRDKRAGSWSGRLISQQGRSCAQCSGLPFCKLRSPLRAPFFRSVGSAASCAVSNQLCGVQCGRRWCQWRRRPCSERFRQPRRELRCQPCTQSRRYGRPSAGRHAGALRETRGLPCKVQSMRREVDTDNLDEYGSPVNMGDQGWASVDIGGDQWRLVWHYRERGGRS